MYSETITITTEQIGSIVELYHKDSYWYQWIEDGMLPNNMTKKNKIKKKQYKGTYRLNYKYLKFRAYVLHS